MFYAYILQSERNSSFYIGSCENIHQRLIQHNKGLGKSTKRFVPWVVVYFEKFETSKEARKREMQIKSWKKRGAIKNLIKHFKKFQQIVDPR